jgi:hypothetical protein
LTDVAAVDPFDLPEWLGETDVTWTAVTSLHSHLVTGHLDDACAEPGARTFGCDLLAADLAYPEPVLAEQWRTRVHQAWWHGETLLLEVAGRLTVSMPGSEVTAEPALDAVRRLAKAVGAAPERFNVSLRL